VPEHEVYVKVSLRNRRYPEWAEQDAVGPFGSVADARRFLRRGRTVRWLRWKFYREQVSHQITLRTPEVEGRTAADPETYLRTHRLMAVGRSEGRRPREAPQQEGE
jgi:hypothetical protein